jgi:hypothetical protein
MPTHATALFAGSHTAHAAVEQLVQAGFTRDAISLVLSESTHQREFGSASSEQSGIRLTRSGVLNAIVSGLVVLSSPNGPALRAAGPLVGAFRRAAEGESPRALTAAFEADGLTEDEARLLGECVVAGSILVGVQATSDRVRLASQLLELAGGAQASSLPGLAVPVPNPATS